MIELSIPAMQNMSGVGSRVKSSLQVDEQNQLAWIKDWIQTNTGILFPDHKIHILKNRVQALCAKSNIPDLDALVKQIQSAESKDIIYRLIDVATTNHTHFFREMQSIEYFVEEIVSTFKSASSLRVWSAASSTGEELYTIILTLCERYPLEDVKCRFSFLGTDISQAVIEQAEKAIYSTYRLTEVPNQIREKWFTPLGLDNWSLSADIAHLCLFRRLNLLDYPWPFANLFHVVFLRNILYYFNRDTQYKMLKQIYDTTLPGGWLITSVAESFDHERVKWKRVQSGIYRK